MLYKLQSLRDKDSNKVKSCMGRYEEVKYTCGSEICWQSTPRLYLMPIIGHASSLHQEPQWHWSQWHFLHKVATYSREACQPISAFCIDLAHLWLPGWLSCCLLWHMVSLWYPARVIGFSTAWLNDAVHVWQTLQPRKQQSMIQVARMKPTSKAGQCIC